MAETTFTVHATGPLFTAKGKQLSISAVENGVKALMEMGEERLMKTLRPRPAGVYKSTAEAGRKNVSKGNYRRNVHGKQRGLSAVINDAGVIYGPWLESGRAGTRFRGYGQFRKTQTMMQKESNKIFNRELKKFAQRMNK